MRSQAYVQSQSFRTIPVQIQANSVLNMSVVELQQFVESEAAENPAMTLKDSCRCSICGFLTASKTCPVCKSSLGTTPTASAGSTEREYLKSAFAGAGSDGFFDPFRTVASNFDIKDYLKQQVCMLLGGRKLRIANYIIDSLDDDGYFREPMFETSLEVSGHVPEIEEVLRVVQSCDPPGIAARDLQECLLAQLGALSQLSEPVIEVSLHVVRECWEDFCKLKTKAMAGALALETGQITEAMEFVRDRLNPYPASVYTDPNSSLSPADNNLLIPDVFVKEHDGSLVAQAADTYESVIGTDPTYQNIYSEIKERAGSIAEEDRKHVKEHVERVRFIMEAIQLRKRTLVKIAQFLVDYQEEYIRTGAAQLKPLKQKEVAQELQVHESTVSRALAGKFCRLPSGEVISFEVFFDSALPVRDMISRLIESSTQPLSDSDIARKLAENGIKLARRTVAKYREQMRLLPVGLRAR